MRYIMYIAPSLNPQGNTLSEYVPCYLTHQALSAQNKNQQYNPTIKDAAGFPFFEVSLYCSVLHLRVYIFKEFNNLFVGSTYSKVLTEEGASPPP